MSAETKQYTLPRMILCEGPEDVGFFSALITEKNLDPFHIEHTGTNKSESGGNTRYCEKLRALRLNRTFKNVQRLLLVTDSDENPGASFENVRAQVDRAGYVAAAQEGQLGSGSPEICIITIPRNAPGNLESTLIGAASVPDPILTAFARGFVDNVANGAEWTQPKRDKLTLRVLVSGGWPRDPGINLSPLFRNVQARRRIPLEHQSFNAIVNLLRTF